MRMRELIGFCEVCCIDRVRVHVDELYLKVRAMCVCFKLEVSYQMIKFGAYECRDLQFKVRVVCVCVEYLQR